MAESSNGYILRQFTVDDFEEYKSWLQEPIELKDLPPTGLVCGDKAMGFLYRTDSTFCVLAFWQVNPKNTTIQSYKAIEKVISGLCDIAKLYGKTNVFIATNNRGMIRLLKRLGFYNADGHLILRLKDD